jgi:hypothetical protein
MRLDLPGPWPRKLTPEEKAIIIGRAYHNFVLTINQYDSMIFDGCDDLEINYKIKIGTEEYQKQVDAKKCGQSMGPLAKCHLNKGHDGEHKAVVSWKDEP